MRHSTAVSVVTRILDAAARRGVNATVACAAADIDPAALANPDDRLPFARVVRLFDACARLSGDAAFGLHAGESSDPAIVDVVGCSGVTGSTVGEWLRRLERYQRVLSDAATLRTHLDRGRAHIEYRYDITDPGPEGRRQDCEAALASLVTGLRRVAGPAGQPLQVSCEHDAPADTSEHSRLFRCPIEFGRTSNALIVDAAMLALEVPLPDVALTGRLDDDAQALCPSASVNGSLAGRVCLLLARALRGADPDLATIARELGLSTRTLQRRLYGEDTSLHDLIDDVRRDLSVRYLDHRDLTMTDVAYLLGFSDPATFHRAFRKWTGLTPPEFRRRNAAN